MKSKSFEWDGREFSWDADILTEATQLRVVEHGKPDEFISLGSLIAMTNGAVLDVLPPEAPSMV